MTAITTQLSDGLLTTREAARYLRVSERTVFSLTANGKLACVRFGRNKRYTGKTLGEFVETCMVRPDGEARTALQIPTGARFIDRNKEGEL